MFTNTSWYKATPTSQQAHLVIKAGSSLLITLCGVALPKNRAQTASSATCRCFECKEKTDVATPAN